MKNFLTIILLVVFLSILIYNIKKIVLKESFNNLFKTDNPNIFDVPYNIKHIPHLSNTVELSKYTNNRLTMSYINDKSYQDYYKIFSNNFPIEYSINNGVIDSLDKVNHGLTDISIVSADIVYDMVHNHNLFSKILKNYKPIDNLDNFDKYNYLLNDTNIDNRSIRFISKWDREVALLIVNQDDGENNINSWNDLLGKKIYSNSNNSSSRYICQKLLYCSELKENDYTLLDEEYENDIILQKFKNKEIDAIFVYSSYPSKFLSLIQDYSIKIITTEGLNSTKLEAMFPVMEEITIDTSDISGMGGVGGNLKKTIGCQTLLVTNNKTDPDYINKLLDSLVKGILDKKDKTLANYRNVLYSPEEILKLINYIDIHKGAKQYYYDFGYITNSDNLNHVFLVGKQRNNKTDNIILNNVDTFGKLYS